MMTIPRGSDTELASSRGVTATLRSTLGMMEAQVQASKNTLETLGLHCLVP